MKIIQQSVAHPLLIALSLLAGSTSARCCCPAFSSVPNPREYRSRYTNVDYRMSVDLPQGMVGIGMPPPNPNHGFTALIPASSHSCLSVEVYYVNPDNSAERHDSVKLHRTLRASEVLDGLETARTVSSSTETCNGASFTALRETLFALAGDRVEGGSPVEEVEYRISIDTDKREYAKARKLLLAVAKSFKRLPTQSR
jgi:hypothetical protein